jgi:hypothetical protein
VTSAGDLTEEHVGKFVGCHDPASGFNYGAKILKVIRNEEHRNPGMLMRIQHPAIPSGKPAHQERMRLRFEQEVQLVELPDLKADGPSQLDLRSKGQPVAGERKGTPATGPFRGVPPCGLGHR